MILVTVRHFVGNEKEALEFKYITDSIIKAKSKSTGIQYKLSLNWPNPKIVPDKVKDIVKEQLNRLYDEGITNESYEGFGTGYTYLKFISNNLAEANKNCCDEQKIIFLIDGNQFDFSDDRVITGIRNISNKLTSDKRLVGLALRDYLKLAEDEDEDEIRRIEELYHLNVCPKIKISNPENIDTSNIHPAYLKYGDILPGMTGYNLNSDIFEDMLRIFRKDSKKVNLAEVQADYYGIMLAGILVNQKNDIGFYSEIIPHSKIMRGTRFEKSNLTKRAESHKQTYIEEHYRRSMGDLLFEKELIKYFKLKNIKEAKKRILEGFK